jgi:hypothetical protein
LFSAPAEGRNSNDEKKNREFVYSDDNYNGCLRNNTYGCRAPPYGMFDNPVHNEVSERYINEALEDTGVLNMVTSIVLDYRAYDTMFETIVLFTAALAVVITIKTSKRKENGE